jgi:hypothetical protein
LVAIAICVAHRAMNFWVKPSSARAAGHAGSTW